MFSKRKIKALYHQYMKYISDTLTAKQFVSSSPGAAADNDSVSLRRPSPQTDKVERIKAPAAAFYNKSKVIKCGL